MSAAGGAGAGAADRAVESAIRSAPKMILYKAYFDSEQRDAILAEAQALLSTVTENARNVAAIAGGSFSFQMEDNEREQFVIVRARGNTTLLQRLQAAAYRHGWNPLRGRQNPTRREISEVGAAANVAHPPRVNRLSVPEKERRYSVPVGAAATNAASQFRLTMQARSSSRRRGLTRYPSVAAATGAVAAILFRTSPPDFVAARAEAERIIRAENPGISARDLEHLVNRAMERARQGGGARRSVSSRSRRITRRRK